MPDLSAKQLRIIFMGTPDFAVASLDRLIQNGYTVVAVITSPDKPAGRGQQLNMSAVKQYALSHQLPILQPQKLKDPQFLDQLRELKADLQIVVAFRMLPDVVWNMPSLGTFNLHASLLPKYRGAAPIHWAVMNGETETGVTTFFLQHEIDTGYIAFRERVPIHPTENTGEVHNKLMHIGADLVLKTVDAVAEGTCPHIPQTDFLQSGEVISEAPKLFREHGKINWELPGAAIVNHIRGLSPYPGTWTNLHEENKEPLLIKIYLAEFEAGTHHLKNGHLIEKNSMLLVAISNGWIILRSIQVAGKKRMSSQEFLRGFRISAIAKLY